jgi:hypothetical protein
MCFRRKTTRLGRMLPQLESFRNVEGQPRQRVVMSLSDAAIADQRREEIAAVAVKRLYGQQELFPGSLPPEVTEWADTNVRGVDLQGRWQPLSALKVTAKAEGTPPEVIVDTG